MTWRIAEPLELPAELLTRVDALTLDGTARPAVLCEAMALGVAALEARAARGRDCLGTVAAELADLRDRVARLQEPAPPSSLFGEKWARYQPGGDK